MKRFPLSVIVVLIAINQSAVCQSIKQPSRDLISLTNGFGRLITSQASHWAAELDRLVLDDQHALASCGLSAECFRELQLVGNGLRRAEIWAYKLWQSSGLAQGGALWRGALDGTFSALGSFSECLSQDGTRDSQTRKMNDIHFCTTHFELRGLARVGGNRTAKPPPTLDRPLLNLNFQTIPDKLKPLVSHVNSKLLPALAGTSGGRLDFGICAPRQCSEGDLELLLHHVTHKVLNMSSSSHNHWRIERDRFGCVYSGMPPAVRPGMERIGRWATYAIIASWVVVLFATMIDLLDINPGSFPLFGCFSLIQNFKRIFSIEWEPRNSSRQTDHDNEALIQEVLKDDHNPGRTRPGPGIRQRLGFLSGFRVLNGIFFVLLHVGLMVVTSFPASLSRIAALLVPERHQPPSHVTFAADGILGLLIVYSLDGLICLSGFLVAVLSLPVWMKLFNGPFNPIKTVKIYVGYLFHRWIRSVPIFMAAVIMTMSDLYAYRGPETHGPEPFNIQIPSLGIRLNPGNLWSGPLLGPVQARTVDKCSKSWWHILVPLKVFMSDHYVDECFPQAWSVVVDFQLYLIAPLVLHLLWTVRYKHRVPLIPMLVPMLGMCIAYNYNQLSADPLLVGHIDEKMFTHHMATEHFLYFGEKILVQWPLHFGPYLIGLALGCELLYQMDHNDGDLQFSHLTNRIFTVLISLLAGGMLLIPTNWLFTPLSRDFFTSSDLLLHLKLSFFSAYQTLWAGVMGWSLWYCATNPNRWLTRFLAHPLWAPLSRLSFGVYVSQIPIIVLMVASMTVDGMPIFLGDRLWLHAVWLMALVGSYSQALLCALLVELPINRLIKLAAMPRKPGSKP